MRYLASGALSGVVATLAFTAVHGVLISDIWFSAIPMAAAGAVCGASLGYSYRLIFAVPSWRSWLGYNAVYVAGLALLGVVSVIVFEPVTTAAALMAANEPPSALFQRATPMIALFLLLMTGGLGRLFGRRPSHYVAIFLTATLVVLLLGLNVAVIGLVDVPSDSTYLIAELFGLIAALAAVYALGVMAVARWALARTPPP